MLNRGPWTISPAEMANFTNASFANFSSAVLPPNFAPTKTFWVPIFEDCACPGDQICHRPHNYSKPVLCVSSTVGNVTQFLAEGVRELVCPAPAIVHESHLGLYIIQVLLLLVFVSFVPFLLIPPFHPS